MKRLTTTKLPFPSVEGRFNRRFAEDIDLLEGTDKKMQDLTSILTDSSNVFGTKTSTDESKSYERWQRQSRDVNERRTNQRLFKHFNTF